jgi:hypothetical protein
MRVINNMFIKSKVKNYDIYSCYKIIHHLIEHSEQSDASKDVLYNVLEKFEQNIYPRYKHLINIEEQLNKTLNTFDERCTELANAYSVFQLNYPKLKNLNQRYLYIENDNNYIQTKKKSSRYY